MGHGFSERRFAKALIRQRVYDFISASLPVTRNSRTATPIVRLTREGAPILGFMDDCTDSGADYSETGETPGRGMRFAIAKLVQHRDLDLKISGNPGNTGESAIRLTLN
jgi:hypothetical protein